MIGIVVITHGQLAQEFRLALEHIVGTQDYFETLAIGPEDDGIARRADVLQAVARVNQGQGVVILTDMFGGTPSNLAISVMSKGEIEVIAGVNLPMLVKLSSVRRECDDLAEACRKAQESGRKYISVASHLLSKE